LPDTKKANRLVGWLVLGAMGLMAVVGLAYALATVDFRRNFRKPVSISPTRERTGAGTGVALLGPAELPALGYLPADCNFIGAVHVAEILHDPVGRRFLVAPRPAPIEFALANVEQWTGLATEDLDHVVFGTRIEEGGPLQLCLVVRSRQPYRAASIAAAQAVQGTRAGEFRGKALYHLKIPLDNGLLWCADDRTLVLFVRVDGTRPEDLNAIPERPRVGADGLSPRLRNVLEKRLGKGTLVWLAGHLDRPGILEPLLTLGQTPPDIQRLVTSIQTFAAGLRFQTGITLLADFHVLDDGGSRRLASFLQRHTAPFAKVVSSPSGLSGPNLWAAALLPCGGTSQLRPLSTLALVNAYADAARDIPPDEANWVTLQVRADGDYIREMLNNVSALLPRMLH
jgi:hypothetical protein